MPPVRLVFSVARHEANDVVVQALANVRHHRGIVVNFIAMIVYIFTSRNNKSVANCETIGESK